MSTSSTSNEEFVTPMKLPASHQYVVPSKVITSPVELNQFLASNTAKSLLLFIQRLGDIVVSKSNSYQCNVSNTVNTMIEVLNQVNQWIDEIPPLSQPMRYGNKAYRTWNQRLLDNVEELHKRFVPESMHSAIQELSPYLIDAMGNATRLDYGTGHELHFVAWLYCLRAVGVVGVDDETALVLKVFPTYLTLIRKLQRIYGLEPAGTHGVWSLDDYQFIPFIWGAAQLTDTTFKPIDILSSAIIDQNYENYIGAASWSKIHQGMMKKFYAEVLELKKLSLASTQLVDTNPVRIQLVN
ncbi:serine/threonine-protein phosphatase 2A regulatory subunit B' [Heterostelium album PN500]|uniref:Serine/threonine-protein phosphatase 2A activator n=1 Tax=Heterostelium pallidum (strain ATCC 26659 / Pp 5 / PN500) TaxID=670386 RepID=D3B586_HETP5|nr:serine/threonine-protein phosphatase 2A regulatory subunit B' [Heterostelium album PN500]EFA83451.1 serine/threonine-protein phosphatase 2A regulatory subunit B' [Heterostelium album PN500]|eukprot:XP_020435568.1 serine/threonine-protein phosphatase 2A regulatory subunit B' [Heterostelium album PN500]